MCPGEEVIVINIAALGIGKESKECNKHQDRAWYKAGITPI